MISGARTDDEHINFEIVDYKIIIQQAIANLAVYDSSPGAVASASLQLRGRLRPANCTYIVKPSDGEVDRMIIRKEMRRDMRHGYL